MKSHLTVSKKTMGFILFTFWVGFNATQCIFWATHSHVLSHPKNTEEWAKGVWTFVKKLRKVKSLTHQSKCGTNLHRGIVVMYISLHQFKNWRCRFSPRSGACNFKMSVDSSERDISFNGPEKIPEPGRSKRAKDMQNMHIFSSFSSWKKCKLCKQQNFQESGMCKKMQIMHFVHPLPCLDPLRN